MSHPLGSRGSEFGLRGNLTSPVAMFESDPTQPLTSPTLPKSRAGCTSKHLYEEAFAEPTLDSVHNIA